MQMKITLESRKPILAIAAIWLTAGVSPAAPQAGQTAPQARPQRAAEAFKNVKTSSLKELTVDDFLGAMGVMSGALAYDCSNCHPGAGFDQVNWVTDTMPTKVMARKMIEMVATINGSNFGGAQMVTCWTCHRGQEKPSTELALDHLYGPPNDEPETVTPRNPRGLPPEQILDKYIAALGGAEPLNRLTSFIATGTQNGGYERVEGGGRFQIFAKAPDQRSVLVTFPASPERGDQTRAYDGHVGWINTPRSVLGEYEVTGTELDGQRLEAQLAFPGQIKQVLTNLRTGFDETIDGHGVQVVQGNGPRGLLVTLYLDKQSGLLRRLIRYGKTPVGRISTQVDYDDYRDVNGIKFPFKFVFSWLDGKDGFQLTDVKTNVPIDPAVFGRPRRATKN
jgi:hypothetical protein